MYLERIEIDEGGLPEPSSEMEQERRVAVFDLQESNHFAVKDHVQGPYSLRLGMDHGRAAFFWRAADGTEGDFRISLGSLAHTAKDYRTLCEAYVDAVRTLPPARIEEIDTARREIHQEAARQLQLRMADRAGVDEPTARRLFTLLCAMTQDT